MKIDPRHLTFSQVCRPAFLAFLASAPLGATPLTGTVEVIQNDAGNNASSVSLVLIPGTSAGVTLDANTSNKGDYVLNFPAANDVAEGVLISTVAENGRDNSIPPNSGGPSGIRYATAGIRAQADGTYYIPVHEGGDGNTTSAANTEFNINTSFGWFGYGEWAGGVTDGIGTASPTLNGTGGLDLGDEFTDNNNGTFGLDVRGLGLGGSSQDGILLVSSAVNESHFALSRANSDGTFTIFSHESHAEGATYSERDVAFVYVTKFRVGFDGLVAMGRVASDNTYPVSGGAFTLVKSGTAGTWFLTIPGHSPWDGTLLVSPEGGNGVTGFNTDNAISCEWDGSEGYWIIQTRDLPAYSLQHPPVSPAPEDVFSFAFFENGSRIYVDAAANGAGNGESWANAYTGLQDAISRAVSGQEILVAEGTYYPDEGNGLADNDRTASFALNSGVRLYGGYPGGGGNDESRNPAAHPTVLSGDIDQDGSLAGNSHHVLKAAGIDSQAILDGFTITAGNAAAGSDNNSGGGLDISFSTGPVIANCSFIGNSATFFGGAIYSRSSSPNFSACSFQGNISGIAGGSCFFSGSSVSLTNCFFQGNSAANLGGAIYNITTPSFLTNCSFQGNSATDDGGAIYNLGSSPGFTNCIIWNNSRAGGTDSPGSSFANATLSGSGGNPDIPSNPTFSHSLVHNLHPPGTNNLDGTNPLNNPRFVSEVDPLQPVAQRTGGDLRLFVGSPASDSGNNTANTWPIDLSGAARIQNGVIDLGAYEGTVNDPALLWNTDFDLDGNPYGVETALGTDPETADPGNPRNPYPPVFNPDGTVGIIIGYNTNAPQGTNWILSRSTSLEPGSFQEISRITNLSIGTPFLFLIDSSPPKPKAFYRFEAEFIPPP